MKQPTDVKSKLNSKVQSDMTAAESKLKTPSKRVIQAPPGPKSAEVDEVDEIYTNADPIDVSLGKRKKGGALTTVVPDKNSKQGKFFFTLRNKGDVLHISEEAKKNALIEAGKVDPAGNVKIEDKPKLDPIEMSLSTRKNAGSLTSTVQLKEKKGDSITPLKLKGG